MSRTYIAEDCLIRIVVDIFHTRHQPVLRRDFATIIAHEGWVARVNVHVKVGTVLGINEAERAVAPVGDVPLLALAAVRGRHARLCVVRIDLIVDIADGELLGEVVIGGANGVAAFVVVAHGHELPDDGVAGVTADEGAVAVLDESTFEVGVIVGVDAAFCEVVPSIRVKFGGF